jgi:protein-tyrosine phosphatase
MARQLIAHRGLDIAVSSAGTNASHGAPASDGSILVGLERRLDLSAHRARAITRAMVDEATLVLAMGTHHLAQVTALGGEGKVFLLSDYAAGAATGRGIADPFGAGLDAYRRMADELDAAFPGIVARLAGDPLAQGPT